MGHFKEPHAKETRLIYKRIGTPGLFPSLDYIEYGIFLRTAFYIFRIQIQ